MTRDQGSGMDEARAHRQRAEREYAEAVSQRPETIAEAVKAVKLRNENHFAESFAQAMRAIRSEAS